MQQAAARNIHDMVRPSACRVPWMILIQDSQNSSIQDIQKQLVPSLSLQKSWQAHNSQVRWDWATGCSQELELNRLYLPTSHTSQFQGAAQSHDQVLFSFSSHVESGNQFHNISDYGFSWAFNRPVFKSTVPAGCKFQPRGDNFELIELPALLPRICPIRQMSIQCCHCRISRDIPSRGGNTFWCICISWRGRMLFNYGCTWDYPPSRGMVNYCSIPSRLYQCITRFTHLGYFVSWLNVVRAQVKLLAARACHGYLNMFIYGWASMRFLTIWLISMSVASNLPNLWRTKKDSDGLFAGTMMVCTHLTQHFTLLAWLGAYSYLYYCYDRCCYSRHCQGHFTRIREWSQSSYRSQAFCREWSGRRVFPTWSGFWMAKRDTDPVTSRCRCSCL